MSYTLKRAVTGSGKDITIDFNRALVSMGTLMPAFEGTAMQEKDKMSFNWQNNSGTGNAEDTDIAMLLVYNKDKEMALYDTEAALRSDSHGELPLPDDWQGDELIAYLSFCSADGSCVANSIRLSVTTVQTAPHVPHSEDSALWTLSDGNSFYPKLKQPVVDDIAIQSFTNHPFTGKSFQSRLYGTG